MHAHVVGIDICSAELASAPLGAYDEAIAQDICNYSGRGDGDLVICQAVLEHVEDVERAFASISTCIKPGGIACIFVPSRNALFARLNLLLHEKIKRRLLFSIFPRAASAQGSKSYYDRCTPRHFKQIGAKYGLEVHETHFYYISSYFSFFFPLYLAWRLWILVFFLLRGKQAAETFSFVFKRRDGAEA